MHVRLMMLSIYKNVLCLFRFSCTSGHYDRAQSPMDHIPLRTGRQRCRGESILYYLYCREGREENKRWWKISVSPRKIFRQYSVFQNILSKPEEYYYIHQIPEYYDFDQRLPYISYNITKHLYADDLAREIYWQNRIRSEEYSGRIKYSSDIRVAPLKTFYTLLLYTPPLVYYTLYGIFHYSCSVFFR